MPSIDACSNFFFYFSDSCLGSFTGFGSFAYLGYLTSLVWNSRLLIFFPQFVKKTKPNPLATGTITEQSTLPDSALKPIEYWEVKIAWSEYRNKKWTQKYKSEGFSNKNLEFFSTEIWSPDWNHFEKTADLPKFFSKVYSENDNQGIFIALELSMYKSYPYFID